MAIDDEESTVTEIVPKNRKLGEGSRANGEEAERWPPWLKPLVNANFYGQCSVHDDPRNSVCNMYCLDCMNGSFCLLCLDRHTKKCTIIQIRRSWYNNVVRVSDLPKNLDISSIKEYKVNGAKVVFLNKRPPIRAGRGVTRACPVCNHAFVSASRFCSLGCMVFWKFNVQKNNQTQSGTESSCSCSSNHDQNRNEVTNHPTARRRKGIPHRAAAKCADM